MTAYEMEDWGFNAAGTPLGGTSALSMPGPRAIDTFGTPLKAAHNQRAAFTKHVQRRYSNISPVNAGLWDPRGEEALTVQPADYNQGMAEIYSTIKDFEAEATRVLEGGMPEFGAAHPNTRVDVRMLDNPATGLSADGARKLLESLRQYDPGIVETIAIPNDISRIAQFNNELGFVSADGRIPDTWIEQDRQAGDIPNLAEAVAVSVLPKKRPLETVDRNGIVQNRYSPGTGPYDAPGISRPGGIAGAIRGTVIRGENVLVRSSGAAYGDSGSGYAVVEPTTGGGKTGFIFGFVGLALVGALGLGMLVSGAK